MTFYTTLPGLERRRVSIVISCRQASDIDNSDENDKEEDDDYDQEQHQPAANPTLILNAIAVSG